MKNVLLLVHDDAGQEARLQVALDIARASGGHLNCLDVTLMPALADCPYDGVGQAILLDDERTREGANKDRLFSRLVHEDVPWSWADVTGAFAPCLRDAAGLADVIVVSRKLDRFPYPDMRAATGELLIRTDKPILAVPDSAQRLNISGRALVAWDGSAAAAAALRAAVPLLRRARSVVLLQIEDGSDGLPAEEAAAYLSGHEIHADIMRDAPLGQPIGKLLLAAIHSQRADYVVMGAFGHGRAVEAVFGGATRTMLSHSPVPVLLAH